MSCGKFNLCISLSCAVLLLSSGTSARTLQEIRNAGEIRIAVALASPWAMRDKDGQLIGYEIDIGRALAADIRAEPRFVVYEQNELMTAVEIGEADIVVSALSISAERALHVNFSAPHTNGGVSLATRLDSTRAVENLSDLDDSTFSLSVVDGSSAAALAERLLPRIEIRPFGTAQEAAAALIDGEVDAYLEEEPVPNFLALEHAGQIDVPLARPLLERRAGFAIAKGDADFIAYLNAWIVAREDDTWLPTTFRYWFRSLRWRDRLSNVPDF